MRTTKSGVVLIAAVVFAIWVCAVAKDCNNVSPPQASHTYRYHMQISKNDSWKQEMTANYHQTHVTPTDESAWVSLLPRARKTLKDPSPYEWEAVYRRLKKQGDFSPPQGFLKPVSLHDVRLHNDSDHHSAQNTNLQYLLMLDIDRLIWSFRKTAGLPTPGHPYAGWEAPSVELRGHFVGHYLSASAQMWASTHDQVLWDKMLAVVGNLSLCQKKINTGYLSAFPVDFFDRLESGKFVWAPYYTIHKIMAGLVDQYAFAGNDEALKMATWMADYFYNRVTNFVGNHTLPSFYDLLNEEFGGMNDVLYRIYNITGDSKYQTLAHLFDKPCFMGLLATQSGDISDLHSNTHIPIVVGAQMRFEIVGDPLYQEIATYFLDLVNSSHAYATGGTSVSEFWKLPDRMAEVLGTENEESCASYNMLKVARNLYRWTKDVSYADYYERTLTNGVLGIQRGTEPGIMIYFLPQGRGVSKARSVHGWGNQFDSFWCCYGTGAESFSKLGDSIYFEEVARDPTLYVAQYISSTLNWKAANLELDQIVAPYSSSDPFLRVTFTFSPRQGKVPSSTLNLRIPTWTHANGSNALLNGKPLLNQQVNGGSYLSVTRKWSAGDSLTLSWPITLRSEHVKDNSPQYSSVHAILYGPFLLVGHTIMDQWDLKVGPNKEPEDYMTAIPATNNSHLFTFAQDSRKSRFVLTNLNLGANVSLTMEKVPEAGAINATHSTYRLVLLDKGPFASLADVINKRVLIEPVHLPGQRLMHQGPENTFEIVDSSTGLASSVFRVVPGLDRRNGTVSIESVNEEGCYLYSGVDYNEGQDVTLRCKSGSSHHSTTFNQAASFVAVKGLKEYHPISFIANGFNRNYLMEPIHSFRDELYTSYLNIYP
ncbi:uncharacterized protein LOC129314454 [Prosopis cineraria]|uniref:uncharacterized protein LOC129314454 n=1 Tax=Prosopis cineraria TaxID=364024 RepID=UPI00240FA71A|nr:uncharacterized protein LOC129314454 [Prosopis cineraria]